MMKLNNFWIILVWIFFWACTGSGVRNIEFKPNPLLLGQEEKSKELDICFAVPAGFVKLTAPGINPVLKNHLEPNIDILHVYKDFQQERWLVVSVISPLKWKYSQQELKNLPDSKLALNWNKVQGQEYHLHDFEVLQWFLSCPEMINYKLLFRSENHNFQVDFLYLPSSFNGEFSDSIDASIASFRSCN